MGKFEATINFYQGRLVIPTWFEKREKGLLFVPGRSSSRFASSSLLLLISMMENIPFLLSQTEAAAILVRSRPDLMFVLRLGLTELVLRISDLNLFVSLFL